MERSRDRDNLILEDADGKPYGVFLAGDYAGDHENGIKLIEIIFGIDRNLPGIPGRTISRTPSKVWTINHRIRVETPESKKGRRRYRHHDIPMLIVGTHDFQQEMLTMSGYDRSDLELLGAFSSQAFAIAAYSDRAKSAIQEIQIGIENLDLVVFEGGGSLNAFGRGGLLIARASKVPAEHAKITFETDMEQRRLDDAANATGIKAKLNAWPLHRGPLALKRYFALAPQWTSAGLIEGRSTAHPVIFFLNPAQQDKNNYGWFTVEELEQWMEGKGPVPKQPASATA